MLQQYGRRLGHLASQHDMHGAMGVAIEARIHVRKGLGAEAPRSVAA